MQWSRQLLKTRPTTRAVTAIAPPPCLVLHRVSLSPPVDREAFQWSRPLQEWQGPDRSDRARHRAREGADLGSGEAHSWSGLVRQPFVRLNGEAISWRAVITATDSGMLVVNRLSMDDYLRGVVPLEIGNRTAAEFAAVQAQAVAARTYAYKHLNDVRAFDMYSTVQDQVYGGVDAEKPQADSAIMTTRDIVVLYAGQPISTPYSSTCGGSTAAVSEVWYAQPDEPYLRPVSDRIPGSDRFYCDPSPRFNWTQNFDSWPPCGDGEVPRRVYERAQGRRRQDYRDSGAGKNAFRPR